MLTKLIDAGTLKVVTITEVLHGKQIRPREPRAIVAVDANKEAYVVLGVVHDIEPRTGQRVQMEFVHHRGGFGGHWKIISELS